MIAFEFSEIANSALSALVYGAIFAILSQFTASLLSALKGVLVFLPRAFIYDGAAIIKLLAVKEIFEERIKVRNKIIDEIIVFMKVLVFGIGLILLSYIYLDGSIRLYMLFISVLSYFVSYRFINPFFQKTMNATINVIGFLLINGLRLIFFLPRKMAFLVVSCIKKSNHAKKIKNVIKCKRANVGLFLDKHKK